MFVIQLMGRIMNRKESDKVNRRYMKHNIIITLSLLLLVVVIVTGCSKNKSVDDYIIYSNHVNSSDELRVNLFKCLEKEDIEYQVDDEKNVLIKKKDNEKAVMGCS